MAQHPEHVRYLVRLFQALSDNGFEDIIINHDGLEPLSVQEDGSLRVIEEMFKVSTDEPIWVNAGYNDHEVDFLFILDNAPEQSLANFTLPFPGIESIIIDITESLNDETH